MHINCWWGRLANCHF